MKKVAVIAIIVIAMSVLLTGCNVNLELETGEYIVENLMLSRYAPGSFIVTDTGYDYDNDKVEEFLINKLVITVTEDGRDEGYNTFYINKKLCRLNVSLIAQGKEQKIIYTGAKYDDNREVRIGFETDEYYMWIVCALQCEKGQKYLSSTIGYGKSERFFTDIKIIKQ